MARFTATWTNTEANDWTAGSFVRETKLKQQFGQNIEYLGQTHNHDGGAGDGGTLATADVKAIWFYGPGGMPFA